MQNEPVLKTDRQEICDYMFFYLVYLIKLMSRCRLAKRSPCPAIAHTAFVRCKGYHCGICMNY